MRQRGISTLSSALLAGLAGALVAVAMMDWVVVDVRTPDTGRIVVPCPLLVPRMAMAFVPDDAMEDATIPPEVRANRELVLNSLQALVDTPDATLVRVVSDDANVEIVKQGKDIVIDVDADDAKVHCRVPVAGIREALEDWDWETADPGLAFDILSEAGNGKLLTVDAEDVQVAISTW